jgi:hypothetical protein
LSIDTFLKKEVDGSEFFDENYFTNREKLSEGHVRGERVLRGGTLDGIRCSDAGEFVARAPQRGFCH